MHVSMYISTWSIHYVDSSYIYDINYIKTGRNGSVIALEDEEGDNGIVDATTSGLATESLILVFDLRILFSSS